MNANQESRCGYVAIVGRPNVGKSTLLNRLVGQKISITSRKPQTTRHHLRGIRNLGGNQIIYVDTPGLDPRPRRTLNRFMNREVAQVLSGVDAVAFVVEALKWNRADEHVLSEIRASGVPLVLVVNKIDELRAKDTLLPFLARLAERVPGAEIVPVSASTGDNIEALERCLLQLLPPGPAQFPDDYVTDRSERFLAAELIREKLMRRLGQEVPHCLSVMIEEFREEGELVQIQATIWVERKGQKAIVIGRRGEVLKAVGEQARHDIEEMLGKKVFLRTWVKIKENWADSSDALRELGFDA